MDILRHFRAWVLRDEGYQKHYWGWKQGCLTGIEEFVGGNSKGPGKPTSSSSPDENAEDNTDDDTEDSSLALPEYPTEPISELLPDETETCWFSWLIETDAFWAFPILGPPLVEIRKDDVATVVVSGVS